MTDDVATGIGATLRQAREAQGRSPEDVAAALRARVTQLHALENNDFDIFGGDVYAKGFIKSCAIELGLDPDPLVEAYRQQYATDDVRASSLISQPASMTGTPRSSPPAWLAWALVAIVVVAGVAFLSQVGAGSRSPETATPSEDVASPPPSSAEEEAEDEDGGPDEDPDADDADSEGAANDADDADEPDEAETDQVELVLAFEEASWTRIEVDGAIVLEETIPAGETLPFEAEQEIQIRFGNAGGVIAELNGEDLGTQGDRGEVVDVVFTPDGAEYV